MYDNNLVMKMHGSTTTREYIRRFVRLVRMDKSALRVDTSRQYWTFLTTSGGGGAILGGRWSAHFISILENN